MRLYTFTITPNNRKVEAFVRHFDLDVDVHHVSFKDKETEEPRVPGDQPDGQGAGAGRWRLQTLGVERDPDLSRDQVSRDEGTADGPARPRGRRPVAALAELSPDAGDGRA